MDAEAAALEWGDDIPIPDPDPVPPLDWVGAAPNNGWNEWDAPVDWQQNDWTAPARGAWWDTPPTPTNPNPVMAPDEASISSALDMLVAGLGATNE